MAEGRNCPIPGCNRFVPTRSLLCARHWRSLTPTLRQAIADAYYAADSYGHAEQTPAYREAVRQAVEALSETQ